jgi:hypothetical protein
MNASEAATRVQRWRTNIARTLLDAALLCSLASCSGEEQQLRAHRCYLDQGTLEKRAAAIASL